MSPRPTRPARTRPRRVVAAGGLLALLATTGCQTTWSDDSTVQSFSAWLSRPFENLARSANPRRFVGGEVRRLSHLATTAGKLSGSELHRPAALMDNSREVAGLTLDRTRALPRRVSDGVAGELRRDRDRLAGLAARDGVPRRLLDPDRAGNRIRHAMADVPVLLELGEPMLSAPDDPANQTVAHPKPSQESFLERVLRRVRL